MEKIEKQINNLAERISEAQNRLRAIAPDNGLLGIVSVNKWDITTTREFELEYYCHGKETETKKLEEYLEDLKNLFLK